MRTARPAGRGMRVLAVGLIFGAGLSQGLQAQEPYLLDTLQVAVDSRLPGEVGSVEVITARRLQSLPVRNLEEALRWSLGVDLQDRSPAQADLSIRGSSFEQVLVLVDGVRMSDPQTGHFDLDLTVPLEQVERIEILRGPASAIYGADAMGGVVNIVTRDGLDSDVSKGTVRADGGSFGRWGWGVAATVPTGPWRLGVSASQDVADGHRDGTDYRIIRTGGRVVGPGAGGRLVLDVGHARRDFGAAEFYAPYNSYEETRTTTATARWVRSLEGGATLEPRVSWRRHEDDFVLERDEPEAFRNLHDSRQLTAELTGRIPLGSMGGLALGGEWSRQTLESTNLGDREQDWRAIFGEVSFRTGGFRLQGGARWDDRDDVGSFVSPSASATFEAGAGISLRAAAGRTFRAPTWTERYYEDPANVGNPDLQKEQGWSAEVGGRARTSLATVSATVYRRQVDDLIDWARPSGADPSVPWETRNVEEARFTGLELSVDELRYGELVFRASAAWIDVETEEAAGFFSKSALRPIIREFNAGVAVPLPDRSALHLLVADRTRRGGGGGPTVDVRLEVGMGNGTLYLDGRNLTDADFADVTGLPVAGRSFAVGIRSPFGG
ncbi:MAG: TonB-dependent receptor [Gemmatimonadota bacterium]